MTTADLLDRLWADADVAIAPVKDIEDFLDDPQVRHNGTVLSANDPTAGAVRQLGPFARFASRNVEDFTSAPLIGEHCDAILTELAIAPERIAELRERGVIR
jgi:crotonobetainyl-CoA:carnitine CoA-transferase CaiB-like acyl-CoA transferase